MGEHRKRDGHLYQRAHPCDSSPDTPPGAGTSPSESTPDAVPPAVAEVPGDASDGRQRVQCH